MKECVLEEEELKEAKVKVKEYRSKIDKNQIIGQKRSD